MGGSKGNTFLPQLDLFRPPGYSAVFVHQTCVGMSSILNLHDNYCERKYHNVIILYSSLRSPGVLEQYSPNLNLLVEHQRRHLSDHTEHIQVEFEHGARGNVNKKPRAERETVGLTLTILIMLVMKQPK